MKRLSLVLTLALAVGLAAAAAPFASSAPDGLQAVAEQHGFAGQGQIRDLQAAAPARGYVFPATGGGRLATGLAGLAGTLVVFAMGYLLAAGMRRWAPARSR